MTATDQHVSIVSGDTVHLTVTVTDAQDNTVDLAGASVRWALSSRRDSTPTLTKSTSNGGVTITDAAAGEFRVELDPSDTASLSGSWTHEAEVTDASGNVSTVLSGSVSIREDTIE